MKSLFFTMILVFAMLTASAQEKKYMLVLLNKKPDAEKLSKEESQRIMAGHMANIEKLAAEGKLLAAGPFDGGGGLFILNTQNTTDATAWLNDDPGVQAKRWNIELLPYIPKVGAVCKVSEPYEMTNYTFIRFNAVVSKSTASSFPQIMNKHNEYVQGLVGTGNVITSAIFGEHDGGILIMKGDVQRDVLEQDPGVQEGLLELDIRKLYIARGSFCEK